MPSKFTPGPSGVVTCEACSWWSKDDDGDGLGSCAILLNDPAARGWRTEARGSCVVWDQAGVRLPIASITDEQVDAALDEWFQNREPDYSVEVLRSQMRAALEAAQISCAATAKAKGQS